MKKITLAKKIKGEKHDLQIKTDPIKKVTTPLIDNLIKT